MLIALVVGLVSMCLAVIWIPFARRSGPSPGVAPWLEWPTYGMGALVCLVLFAAFGVFCIASLAFAR